jgi:flavin-dependent dehydrogenase
VITHKTDHIIIADGKGALLATPPPPTGNFGIKAHFQDIDGPRDTIELFGCNGLYGGLAAIEDGRWNVAFSVPADRLKFHHGNIAALFAEIVGENRVLSERMSRARQIGDWLASPLPRFAVKNHWPAAIIPVGNAAAAVEPIGGEGMGLAMQSAELAASSFLTGGDVPLLDGYRSLWRTRRPSCRATALLVSRPGLASALVSVLRASPLFGEIGLRLLGK